jgi:hypothetical protein
MDAPKILSVKTLENKMLLVKFINGIEKIYDCTKILKMDMFKVLKNEGFFKCVNVDAGGYGISWNGEADLSEYELWTNGVEVVMAPA